MVSSVRIVIVAPSSIVINFLINILYNLCNKYLTVDAGADPGFERRWVGMKNFVGKLHENCALSTIDQKLS